MYISKKNSLKMEDKEYNFWIHRVDLDIMDQIHENKILGAQKGSRNINKIYKNDIILFWANRNTKEFFAYTKVEEKFKDNEPIYNEYYDNKWKLKLKGIKYFSKPIPIKEISNELGFVKNKTRYHDYFKTEYKPIPKEDFMIIRRNSEVTNEYPDYLDNVVISLEDFILNTINSLYFILKSIGNKKQIEIRKFISLLKSVLSEYGVYKSSDEILDFYTKNAHKLGFKHIPSRDNEKFVPLYSPSGEKRNFAYISLE